MPVGQSTGAGNPLEMVLLGNWTRGDDLAVCIFMREIEGVHKGGKPSTAADDTKQIAGTKIGSVT
jgi:hypothetical protein